MGKKNFCGMGGVKMKWVGMGHNFVIVLIFAPFNFAVLVRSRNKGHANINGFTI